MLKHPTRTAGRLLRREPDPVIGEVREPIPAKRPARALRLRISPQRHGQPVHLPSTPRPWRKVKVTDRRTSQDFAHCMRDWSISIILTPGDPGRARQLSTIPRAPLYDASPLPRPAHPQAAGVHHTPKHASWLNMVEIEIGGCGANASTAASTTRTLIGEIDAWEPEKPRAPDQLDVHHRQGPRKTSQSLSPQRV